MIEKTRYMMSVRNSVDHLVFKIECSQEFVDDGMFFDLIDSWSLPGYVITIKPKAIKMIKAKLNCMTREVSGIDQDCNNGVCSECSLNYEQGNMGEQKEWLRMSVEALEQQVEQEEMTKYE